MGKYSKVIQKAGDREESAQPTAAEGAQSAALRQPRESLPESEDFFDDVPADGPEVEVQSPGAGEGSGAKRRRMSSFKRRSRKRGGADVARLDKSLCMDWEPRFFRAVHESSTLPELFKILRARIQLQMGDDAGGMSILVTSAMPGEGKSFVSANLAIAFSEGVDRYAMLCDSNLRSPSLSALFGSDAEARGLVDYLREGVSPGELIVSTGVPKLSLLPSGVVPENPAELVSSEMMRELVEELTFRYEDRTIIFDSPAIMAAGETRTLASQVDGVLIVVRQGVPGRAQIEETINAVGRERILGIVFNDFAGSSFGKASKYSFGMSYNKEN